jgi:alanyl-tRNA synthetase
MISAQSIREAFLDFFARRGHRIVRSSSLLPKDDPTILFTNAGMNQFKNVFLGLEKRSYNRAVSVQKCMRVSGKHNDLEQVGRTAKHHTFFEMLGNFSFGDYFKREAAAFAWELVTEVFKLAPSRLYITVFEDDDEAFRIWNDDIRIPAERIFRFGKKDNYWAMGDTGPCGPCSELHYDAGESLGEGEPRALIESGSDRFVELWNLVFMQFTQDEKGCLTRLPRPSIDTGMGLERITAALQGKTSNWDTDLFQPLIRRLADLAGREYPSGGEDDVSLRIIADHLRAVTFLIGDGIMPANDGRGYVLRRLIRRAFRRGNLVGLEKPFLYTLVGSVGDMMKDAYPELLTSMPFIARICQSEEERFATTLASGLKLFDQFVEAARKDGRAELRGDELFKLYDTFGFPVDLSQELAVEKGLGIDAPGFEAELETQKTRARASWKGSAPGKEKKAYEDLKPESMEFVGYDTQSVSEARVIALIRHGKRVPSLKQGEEGELLLDRTPFYAEAGGQVGDSGEISGPHFSALVENTYYPIPELRSHKVRLLSGAVGEGDLADASVDAARRRAISANHTATHLLHAALRDVLGAHVKQAGSLVSPARLRFDFTHFAQPGREELLRVEQLVNEKIREDLPVTTKVTSLEEGIREGAMAIFEEKYGERVRMVTVGDYSRELCGGVHLPSTGRIGLFKIVSETSVAAGMRRIEALTAEEALSHVESSDGLLEDIQRLLGSSRADLPAQVEKLRQALKDKEREVKSLRQKAARTSVEGTGEDVKEVKGIRVLVRRIEGLGADEVRDLADALKQKLGSGIVILGQADGAKAVLVVSVTKDLAGRAPANKLIKAVAAFIGGTGGGRPDFAQAGGSKPENLDEALDQSFKVLEELL